MYSVKLSKQKSIGVTFPIYLFAIFKKYNIKLQNKNKTAL